MWIFSETHEMRNKFSEKKTVCVTRERDIETRVGSLPREKWAEENSSAFESLMIKF